MFSFVLYWDVNKRCVTKWSILSTDALSAYDRSSSVSLMGFFGGDFRVGFFFLGGGVVPPMAIVVGACLVIKCHLL